MTILKISEDDFLKFAEENLRHRVYRNKASSFSLGYFLNKELIGVAQWGAPRNRKDSKRNSIELYQLFFKKSSFTKKRAKSLIDFYIRLCRPADFFVCSKNIDYQLSHADISMKIAEENNKWEWIDINRTYYTYKITATNSKKYYYGVSHVKISNATIQDCLDHNYYGSGGSGSSNKFKNWKKKYRENLVKEVINRFQRKAEAFEDEKELVSDLWKSDIFCLNSSRGGITNSWDHSSLALVNVKKCEIHGASKHRGERCIKCIMQDSTHYAECPIHERTLFQGSMCLKCRSKSKTVEEECEEHGQTLFKNGACLKCFEESLFSIKTCEKHGETNHRRNICCKCLSQKSIKIKKCKIHGETFFRKDSCSKCASSSKNTKEKCDTHGLTNHVKGVCSKCHSASIVKIKECKKHGMTKFIGESCVMCIRSKDITIQNCPTHGETKFRSKSGCIRCTSQASVKVQTCEIHGETKHRGGKCFKCTYHKG